MQHRAAFVTLVVDHWLEREIVQCHKESMSTMSGRSSAELHLAPKDCVECVGKQINPSRHTSYLPMTVRSCV